MTRTQSERDAVIAWVEEHKSREHDAHVTQIGAPGTGIGSHCFTCDESGPDTARILTIEDVR